MSDSLALVLVVFFGEILPAGISLYAAYWAFTVRKALVVRIYRSQALWLGAFCFPFAVAGFITYTNSPIIEEAINIYFAVLIMCVFAWVDSTMPVARRSDPLLRSVLHWEKVRLVVWPTMFGLMAIILYVGSTTNLATNLPPLFFEFLLLAYVVGPFVIGAPAVLIAARRSRDPALRGSLKWFGILLSMLLLSILVSNVEQFIFGVSNYDLYYSYPAFPSAVFVAIAAYSLYMSARSLAPTSRLSAIESAPMSSTGAMALVQEATSDNPTPGWLVFPEPNARI